MERNRQDLTVQKDGASEESVESLYRTIVEDQTDLLCRCSGDGLVLYANQAYCRFFGKQPDEVIGHPVDPLIRESVLQTAASGPLAPTRANPDTSLEMKLHRADGIPRWVQWTVHTLFDEEGRPAGFQTAGRDITERRDAEDLLNLQYEVTLALAEAATVNEAMRRTLQAVCQSLGWDLAI
ncbi:MAG TPA: PAS domain S-box protein, partial [Bacteroidota bacterium]